MAYTINLTNGDIFAVIADGTVNTAAQVGGGVPLVLVGKNYAGYGEFLDENFIHLLENGAGPNSPGAPLAGQLWYDSTAKLIKIYSNGGWKNICAATALSYAPDNNVQGDLWYDTVNAQLKVWTGTQWLLVGPQFTAQTGVTGAIVDTIVDNQSASHVVIKLYVQDNVVGIVSKDGAFTPQTGIPGFTTQGVLPGITLSTGISGNIPLFQGTATNATSISGIGANSFMRTNADTSTTGTLGVINNTGLTVGTNSDFRASVTGTAVTLANQTTNGNLSLSVSVGGVPTQALTVIGTTGQVGVVGITNLNGNGVGNIGSAGVYFDTVFAKATSAQYADVAERFHADQEYLPGTVVELGGSAEITRSVEELSENVFGVISTNAAYLMNSGAGSNATHPPIAMTGRVPVRTIGSVRKGDRLVSAGNGLARAAQAGEATAFNTVGRALHDKADVGEGTVEAIVTIK